jgi:hypothetical protein
MPGDEAQPRNAVGIIGRIEPFEDTVETWKSYTERLEQYFEVNDIAEDKKVPALLTLLGGKTYTLLRNLTAPNKPKEKDYTTLVNLLRDHLTPKPIVTAERFRFHKRNQLQCESVNASRRVSFKFNPNSQNSVNFLSSAMYALTLSHWSWFRL